MTTRKPLVQVNGELKELPAGDTFAKAAVGLSNVDNTSDMDKPVSTAQQAAINAVSGGGYTGPSPTALAIIFGS